MILVYGDDSADEKQERVCAVAGVVGTIMAWRSVERQWIAMTNGIPFHAKDCDSDEGDYKNFPYDENKKLYRDLTIILAESHLHGYGLAIDLMAATKVFPRAADFAYYRCFLRVMQVMKNCAKANQEPFGSDAVNNAVNPIQRGVIDSLGLEDLTKLKIPSSSCDETLSGRTTRTSDNGS